MISRPPQVRIINGCTSATTWDWKRLEETCISEVRLEPATTDERQARFFGPVFRARLTSCSLAVFVGNAWYACSMLGANSSKSKIKWQYGREHTGDLRLKSFSTPSRTAAERHRTRSYWAKKWLYKFRRLINREKSNLCIIIYLKNNFDIRSIKMHLTPTLPERKWCQKHPEMHPLKTY